MEPVVLNPDALNFGFVQQGQSTTRTFELKAVTPIIVSKITTDPAAVFSVSPATQQSFAAGQSKTFTVTINSSTAGGISGSVDIEWTPQPQQGFVLNPLFAKKRTSDVNLAAIVVGKPDLIVTLIGTPTVQPTGDPAKRDVTVSLNIQNVGSGPSVLCKGQSIFRGNVKTTFDIDPLNPGRSVTKQVTFQIGQAGDLVIRVDSDAKNVEANENNNEVTANLAF